MPSAESAINALKSRLNYLEQRHRGVKLSFQHIGISDIGDFFESPDATPRKPTSIRLRFAFDKLKFDNPHDAAIRSSHFVTFYAPATDLVSAARKEGVALFDANVRYELSSSNINEEIRRTATHPRSMKNFHLYNNGVTIIGSGWTYKNNKSTIEIRDPSIINGCQTVRTLARAKKELEESAIDNAHALQSFEDTCLVLVRLVSRDTINPEEIVRAANTQNAMEPRNLLSNRTEQRMTERELYDLGWFYERKDGAIEALRESKKTSLAVPLSTFQVRQEKRGKKTIRSCDNREMARCWLSFIGYSDDGKNKRRQHFAGDGTKGMYAKIFRQTPLKHRDVAILDKIGSIDAILREGRPPSLWMLYSYHLFQLVKRVLPVATRLRARIRRDMLNAGQDVSLPAVNDRMLNDDTTRLSFALSMLDHVVLEIAGFIFARALGENWLASAPGRRAISSGIVGKYHDLANMPSYLQEESILLLPAEDIKKDPALLAIRLAVQGIEATLKQPEYLPSFRSSERKSRYLQSEPLLRAYAEKVDEYDSYFSEGNFVKWWKGGSPYAALRELLLPHT